MERGPTVNPDGFQYFVALPTLLRGFPTRPSTPSFSLTTEWHSADRRPVTSSSWEPSSPYSLTIFVSGCTLGFSLPGCFLRVPRNTDIPLFSASACPKFIHPYYSVAYTELSLPLIFPEFSPLTASQLCLSICFMFWHFPGEL